MNYLRRQTDRNIALLGREDFLIAQVTRSVERNFNGHKEMEIVRSSFSLKVRISSELVVVLYHNYE